MKLLALGVIREIHSVESYANLTWAKSLRLSIKAESFELPSHHNNLNQIGLRLIIIYPNVWGGEAHWAKTMFNFKEVVFNKLSNNLMTRGMEWRIVYPHYYIEWNLKNYVY